MSYVVRAVSKGMSKRQESLKESLAKGVPTSTGYKAPLCPERWAWVETEDCRMWILPEFKIINIVGYHGEYEQVHRMGCALNGRPRWILFISVLSENQGLFTIIHHTYHIRHCLPHICFISRSLTEDTEGSFWCVFSKTTKSVRHPSCHRRSRIGLPPSEALRPPRSFGITTQPPRFLSTPLKICLYRSLYHISIQRDIFLVVRRKSTRWVFRTPHVVLDNGSNNDEVMILRNTPSGTLKLTVKMAIPSLTIQVQTSDTSTTDARSAAFA